MAEAALGFRAENRKKKPRFVTPRDRNGNFINPVAGRFGSANIPRDDPAEDDGFTYRLTPAFFDGMIEHERLTDRPAGHASNGEPIIAPPAAGSMVHAGENTFRYRRFNRGRHAHAWFTIYHSGDAECARISQPAGMVRCSTQYFAWIASRRSAFPPLDGRDRVGHRPVFVVHADVKARVVRRADGERQHGDAHPLTAPGVIAFDEVLPGEADVDPGVSFAREMRLQVLQVPRCDRAEVPEASPVRTRPGDGCARSCRTRAGRRGSLLPEGHLMPDRVHTRRSTASRF